MMLVRVRKFMAREYEHLKRFLSHKDPNYMLGLRQEQRAVARVSPGSGSADTLGQYPEL